MNSANATRAATTAETSHHAKSAVPVIEGQQVDRAFLDRLHAARVEPEGLAAIVACAHFKLMHAMSRLVQKALGVRHG